MSANNLSQELFHGTHVELQPGDVVKPRHLLDEPVGNYGSNPVYGEDVHNHAYAVNNLEEAKWFAKESVRLHGGSPRVYAVTRRGRTKSRPLYDVTNEDLPKEAQSITEHLSKQGFTVKREIK